MINENLFIIQSPQQSIDDGKGWQRSISIEDISINKNKLRQDAIENGIKPEISECDLWEIEMKINSKNFDEFQE